MEAGALPISIVRGREGIGVRSRRAALWAQLARALFLTRDHVRVQKLRRRAGTPGHQNEGTWCRLRSRRPRTMRMEGLSGVWKEGEERLNLVVTYFRIGGPSFMK